MKKLFVLAASCTLAFACATAPQFGGTSSGSRSLASVSNSRTIEDHSTPAANSDQPKPQPQTFSVAFTGADLRGGALVGQKTIEVPISIVVPEPYMETVTDYEWRDKWGYVPCQKKVKRPGASWRVNPANRHPSWVKFSNARTDADRARHLAEAIDQLGPTYAKKLVAGKVFINHIPASWDEMKLAINKGYREGLLTKAHVTNILENSEVENQIRLGYELTDAYDVVNTTCYVVVGQEKVVVGSHQEKRYRNVTRQVGLVKRDISLEVRGGTLLPSEKEVITFWVSAGKEEVKVMDTHHNNYQYRTRDVSTTSEVISGLTVTRIKTEVLLTAVARARTPARNSMLDGIELMSASDGLNLEVTMDPSVEELFRAGPGGNFVIRYEVEACKPKNWWYACRYDYQKFMSDQVTAENRVQKILIPDAKLKGRGWKYRVRVLLDFTNNAYYSGTTATETSDKIMHE